jgi:hypothetical protein
VKAARTLPFRARVGLSMRRPVMVWLMRGPLWWATCGDSPAPDSAHAHCTRVQRRGGRTKNRMTRGADLGILANISRPVLAGVHPVPCGAEPRSPATATSCPHPGVECSVTNPHRSHPRPRRPPQAWIVISARRMTPKEYKFTT